MLFLMVLLRLFKKALKINTDKEGYWIESFDIPTEKP